MSKAMLVIDMPEKCDYCELLYHCHKDDEPYDPNAKPDWCPLRPIPEKKRVVSYLCDQEYYANKGYNNCIADIIQEEENCPYCGTRKMKGFLCMECGRLN